MKQVANVGSDGRSIWIRSLILGLLGSIVLSGPAALAEDMRPEVEERVKKATLMVFNKASKQEKGDTPLGSGSGYFINSTGLLITNNHVVDPGHGKDPATKWKLTNQYNLLVQTVITDSGTEDEKEWECDLLYTNEYADQALLQALDEDGEKLETPNFLRFMPESRLREGIEIVAMGFPGGDSRRSSRDKHPEANVVKGNVLEIPRTSSGRARMITTDAELRAGNSGGPVVNRDGLLVGTLTLGISNEERRNYNGLVPAALTRGFITGAFTLNKIPGGTDYAPLMEMLTSSQNRLEIPEYSRLKDQDVLYFEDGDRIYGRMEGATITWDSALGAITVPASTVAYVLNNDEASHLFLKGGNRIASDEADATFEFTPVDGEKISRDFSDVKAIAFRLGDVESSPEVDRLIVLDSDLTNLRLSKVEGTVGFNGKAGTIQLKLQDIERIESTEDDEHRVILADGRKMTGEFSDDKFKGTIAATNTIIEFGLGGVTTAMVEFVNYDPNATEGLDLSDLLTSAGREERELLKLLRAGDAASVRTKIDEITAEKKSFRERSEKQRERFQLLHAVATMRDGDGTASQKLFRRVRKSKNENIAAYGQACIDILKEYDDFKFRDRPLSDKTVFVAAGEALSGDYIRTTRNAIEDGNSREGKNKGEYFGVMSAVKKNEPKMQVAAIFRGSLAEHELVRLWRMAVSASQRELRRIQNEQQEIQEEARQRGGRAGGAMRRKLDELGEHRDRVGESMGEYRQKLQAFGFRIEDPDLQKIREREEERRAEAQDRDD